MLTQARSASAAIAACVLFASCSAGQPAKPTRFATPTAITTTNDCESFAAQLKQVRKLIRSGQRLAALRSLARLPSCPRRAQEHAELGYDLLTTLQAKERGRAFSDQLLRQYPHNELLRARVQTALSKLEALRALDGETLLDEALAARSASAWERAQLLEEQAAFAFETTTKQAITPVRPGQLPWNAARQFDAQAYGPRLWTRDAQAVLVAGDREVSLRRSTENFDRRTWVLHDATRRISAVHLLPSDRHVLVHSEPTHGARSWQERAPAWALVGLDQREFIRQFFPLTGSISQDRTSLLLVLPEQDDSGFGLSVFDTQTLTFTKRISAAQLGTSVHDEPGPSALERIASDAEFAFSANVNLAILNTREEVVFVDIPKTQITRVPLPDVDWIPGNWVFSADERFALTLPASDAESPVLFDRESHSIHALPRGDCELETVTKVIFSDSGRLAALGTRQGKLCVYNTLAKRHLRTISIPPPANKPSISTAFDLATPETIPIAFSADDRVLVAEDLSESPLGRRLGYDVHSGRVVPMPKQAHVRVTELVSPNRKLAVTVEGPPRVVAVDGATFVAKDAGLAATEQVATVGSRLVVASDTSQTIIELGAHVATESSNSAPRVTRGPLAFPFIACEAAFTPGEWPKPLTRFVMVPANARSGLSEVCDRQTNKRLLTIESSIRPLLSPGGESVAYHDDSGTHDRLVIRHLSTSAVDTVELDGILVGLPKNNRLLVMSRARGETEFKIWHAERKRVLGKPTEVTLEESPPGGSRIAALAMSEDDAWILIDTKVFDVFSGKLIRALPTLPRSALFLPSGALVTANDREVGIYAPPKFELIGSFYVSETETAVLAWNEGAQNPELEIRGSSTAFDGQAGCRVGNYGVPFRVCRELFQSSGLTRRLLGRP